MMIRSAIKKRHAVAVRSIFWRHSWKTNQVVERVVRFHRCPRYKIKLGEIHRHSIVSYQFFCCHTESYQNHTWRLNYAIARPPFLCWKKSLRESHAFCACRIPPANRGDDLRSAKYCWLKWLYLRVKLTIVWYHRRGSGYTSHPQHTLRYWV